MRGVGMSSLKPDVWSQFAKIIVVGFLPIFTATTCFAQTGAIAPDPKRERSPQEITMAKNLLEALKALTLSNERHLEGEIEKLFGLHYDVRVEEQKDGDRIYYYRWSDWIKPESNKFPFKRTDSRYFDTYGDLSHRQQPETRDFTWGVAIDKSKLCITTQDVRAVFEQDSRFQSGEVKWPGYHYASDPRWDDLQKRGGEWWSYDVRYQIGEKEKRRSGVHFAHWSCASGIGLSISVLK